MYVTIYMAIFSITDCLKMSSLGPLSSSNFWWFSCDILTHFSCGILHVCHHYSLYNIPSTVTGVKVTTPLPYFDLRRRRRLLDIRKKKVFGKYVKSNLSCYRCKSYLFFIIARTILKLHRNTYMRWFCGTKEHF